MRKETYKKYSLELATKICDIDPSVPWTILGVGPFSSGSENQQSEPVTDIIVAPLRGARPSLKEAVIRSFPVGCIEFFQLRRSWYQGTLSEEHFRSNNVTEVYARFDTGKYKVCSLGELWNGQLDNEAIKLLKGVKYLTYETVVNRKTIKLAVPCSEVFRFYYSPSSNFASATLSGKKANECIFNPDNRVETEEKAVARGFHCVTLRKSIEDACAPYVARLALSEYACHSFDSIFELTHANQIKNPEHYLICQPPLNQETSWDVDGLFVDGVFFVTRIKRCFGKFPFVQVLFDRDNNRMGNRKQKPKETKIITKKKPIVKEQGGGNGDVAEDDNDEPTIVGDAPSPSVYVDQVQLEVLDGNPIFQYLDNNSIAVQKVVKATILNEDTQTITVLDGEQIVDKLTTTSASGDLGNESIAQLKIVQLRKSIGGSHDFTIYDVMSELESLLLHEKTGDVSAYYLNGEIHPELDFASIVPFDEYKNQKLCFINEEDKKHYFASEPRNDKFLRPMICFKITYMECYYYFVEFLAADGLSADGTSSLLFTNYLDEAPDKLIINEIKKFDQHGASWKTKTVGSKPKPTSIFAHRFVHRKTDVEKKVALILKELKRGESEF